LQSSQYLYLANEYGGANLRKLSTETAIEKALTLLHQGLNSKDTDTPKAIRKSDIEAVNKQLKYETGATIQTSKPPTIPNSNNQFLQFCKTGTLAERTHEHANIFTDGSKSDHTSSYAVYIPQVTAMNVQTKASGDITVNRAELRAVTHATIIAANFSRCSIYTDSQYAT